MKKAYLGVDVGSISVNFALINSEKDLLFKSYLRGSGDPIQAIQQGLSELSAFLPRGDEYEIAGVCTTGSGRELAGILLGADLIKNEISAHAAAAIHVMPDVRTVIEIGGQDSKVTIIRDGVVVDFAMNLVCAAGTGSFLDSQSRRLGLSIEKFGEIALMSENPTAIAGRCTVFAESDMIHKQQIGFPQKDIVMGLCLALARNFVGNVCRGKDLRPPFLFQGGVSANPAIKRAFETVLGFPVAVPPNNMVMGAYGAAMLVLQNAPERTLFLGGEIAAQEIHSRGFMCSGCSNQCEIIELLKNGIVAGRIGGRCEKWRDTGQR
ncbi:MAG: acyl-CoA dehydratase activase [Spirochaetia bacterium]|nr:acyl-CoA dehydratase activase [Spirochaetia bacterium]